MTYRHDTRHLTRQQQEIIRKKDEEDRRRKEEYEKTKQEELLKAILNLLEKEGKPLSLNEIAEKLNVVSGKVLKVINPTPHNIIKRELEENKIVYEIK